MTDSTPETKDTLVIDLNFVPGWARKPPEQRAPSAGEFAPPPRERREPDQDARRRGPPDRRSSQGGRRLPRRDQPRPVSPPAPDPVDERLAALEVSFLPERRGLAPLAGRLAKSFRAYSLFEVASLFLSKPDYYLVKIEVPAAVEGLVFFQCMECKAVFPDRNAACTHAFTAHFDKFCGKEEREAEAPKGNFVCVAKCGLSGALLGPPNYHGYNDKVAEIHRLRYPDMPMEAYRKRIETLHDAALIEQWKEEMKKTVVYHFGEGEKRVSFSRFSEAETYFREHMLPETVKEMKSVVIPGSVAHAMEQGPLRRVIEEAWQRESRFPLKLSVVLRLAFRHFGLHTFKAAGGHTFVTSVVPSAIDPAHAIELVREILDHVSARPGCVPTELLTALCPAPVPGEDGTLPAPPPEAKARETDIRRQLQWLVEKGHVIEFSDGRLAVPTAAVARVQIARPKGKSRKG